MRIVVEISLIMKKIVEQRNPHITWYHLQTRNLVLWPLWSSRPKLKYFTGKESSECPWQWLHFFRKVINLNLKIHTSLQRYDQKDRERLDELTAAVSRIMQKLKRFANEANDLRMADGCASRSSGTVDSRAAKRLTKSQRRTEPVNNHIFRVINACGRAWRVSTLHLLLATIGPSPFPAPRAWFPPLISFPT